MVIKMPENMIKDEIDKAGLSRALSNINKAKFVGLIDKLGVGEALTEQSFYRFLESLVRPSTLPATWQKLADLGWSDDEVSSLLATKILKVEPTTLKAAISMGALALDEYNEFSDYPNQEVDIIFYGKAARTLLAWLRKQLTLPKIDEDTFVE